MQKQSHFPLSQMLINLMGITTLLVFTSLPSSELLASQKVEPLPDAAFFASVQVSTDESIRKRIVRETPGLATALAEKEDLEIIRLLRGWAADNMDLNERGTSYWLKLDPSNRTLGNMLYLFDHDLLGVHCGDGSRFLKKIYSLFGYEAHLYNSGVYFRDPQYLDLNEGYTHEITLVKIRYRNKDLWVAEDILFDTEYRLHGEVVSDFGDILTQLGSTPHARIDRLHDKVVFDRERLSISQKEAEAASRFEEFARGIQVKSGPDQFKLGWATWIKQESTSAEILRNLLNINGPIYPYHLFRFPIPGSWRVPAARNLLSVEELYRSQLALRTETYVTLGK